MHGMEQAIDPFKLATVTWLVMGDFLRSCLTANL